MLFRSADLVLRSPQNTAPVLLLLAEAGPGTGFEPCPVEVVDAKGRVVASVTIGTLGLIRLELPPQETILREVKNEI